jgi:hypothetical protein
MLELLSLKALVPAALTAATRNTYAVVLTSPVTVALVTLDVSSEKSLQLVPPSEEY